MAFRINSDGLLEVLHPESGAYVPASTLLQVEGGMRVALAPEQQDLLASIRSAADFLQEIDRDLQSVRVEAGTLRAGLSQANLSLNLLADIDSALRAVATATDSLEVLLGEANNLLGATRAEIVNASIKLPGSVGIKNAANSLSVALASDSAVLSSLAGVLSALSDGGNSLSALASAISSKLPGSVGIKNAANSLSVALASDSAVLSSLTSIFNALSDGTNSALSRLSVVATAQFWGVPTKLNGSSPIVNAASSATSSAAYSLSSQATAFCLQNFFSAVGAQAQFAIELRTVAGATSLSDKQYYYRGDVATPFLASAGAYPGESPIIVPTQGFVQVVVNLHSISGGSVTVYGKEIG